MESLGLCFLLPQASFDAVDIFFPDRRISAPLGVAAVCVSLHAKPAFRLHFIATGFAPMTSIACGLHFGGCGVSPDSAGRSWSPSVRIAAAFE